MSLDPKTGAVKIHVDTLEELDKVKTGLEELKQNAALDPADPAFDPMAGPTALFALYGPQLMALTDKLSNRQLKRLLKYLVMYPLEDIKLNMKNPVEVEAFKIADRLVTSKYLMILGAAFEDEEKKRLAKEQLKKDSDLASQQSETKEETKQEVTNG
jgi:hypothetical protein